MNLLGHTKNRGAQIRGKPVDDAAVTGICTGELLTTGTWNREWIDRNASVDGRGCPLYRRGRPKGVAVSVPNLATVACVRDRLCSRSLVCSTCPCFCGQVIPETENHYLHFLYLDTALSGYN